MNGYSGKIIFYKYLGDKMDGVYCTPDPDGWAMKSLEEDNERVYLGEKRVSVDFVDTRNQEITALEEKVAEERASSQVRINQYLGQIQELKALEHIE